MTPLGIEILLHYQTRGDQFPRLDAPAVAEAVETFCRLGLLERVGSANHYRGTDGTRVYLDALCNVPLPVHVWVMPPTDEAKS